MAKWTGWHTLKIDDVLPTVSDALNLYIENRPALNMRSRQYNRPNGVTEWKIKCKGKDIGSVSSIHLPWVTGSRYCPCSRRISVTRSSFFSSASHCLLLARAALIVRPSLGFLGVTTHPWIFALVINTPHLPRFPLRYSLVRCFR